MSAESDWRSLNDIRRAYYNENRSELERLAARIAIFTFEPILTASKKIGARAVTSDLVLTKFGSGEPQYA